MTELPAGTVTFLFTDIEGSTRLLRELGDRYAGVLTDHHRLLREVFETHGGREVDTQGDSFFVAFGDASDAVRAAGAAQRALAAHRWPGETDVRVRMGIHTGEPLVAGDNYVGIDVHRAARIAAAAYGGQVLLSARTGALVQGNGAGGKATLRELGEFPLKDLPEPERLYQLVLAGLSASFPPPRVDERAPAAAGLPDYSLPPADVPCPYKGLVRFEPEDSDLFFGREELLSALVQRLKDSPFLAVVGPSGSGKSSLVRAGVVPELQRREASLHAAIIEPGEHPMTNLARIENADLVVVDQFEEVFTLCRDDEERLAFIDRLLDMAAQDARVVVVLRADFYGHCTSYGRLAAALEDDQALIGPMTEEELRRSIERPAERAGLVLEPGLAEGVLRDVVGEPGALPLLSHSLLETWRRRSDRMLTLVGYLQSGGVRGSIAKTAETVYREALSPEQQTLARNIFLRLTEFGKGTEDTRRRVRVRELTPRREQARDVQEVLRVLVDARLITTGEGTVEVAHEALIRHWPTLREWLDEDREGRLVHRRLTEAAQEWETLGQDPGTLYRGARLAAALDWTADHELDLNELERAFVTESSEFAELEAKQARRTNRRLRGLLAGVAVLLAVAVGGGILALVQRGEARDAETAQLAQRLGAQALSEEHLDLSLLLARQAVAIDDSPQTNGYLLATLRRSPAANGIMHGSRGLGTMAAISPDGKTLAVAGGEGDSSGEVALLFFDARTYEQSGAPLSAVASGDASVAYSPDGRTVAIGGDRAIRLIDARTHERLAKTTLDGAAMRLAFTSDGSRLVVLVAYGAEDDARITIHDAATLREIGPAIEPENFTGAFVNFYYTSPTFALTADDRSLVTASEGGELAWWDLRSRRKTRTLRTRNGLHALTLSPDGRTAAVGVDGGIELVDVRAGTRRPGRGGPAGNPNWLLFSPDGRTVVATNLNGTVTLWDADSGALRKTLRGHSNSVQQPVFSPDGETLYTVSFDDTAIAWDLKGDRGLGRPFTFTHDRTFSAEGFDNGHPGVFSPDGRLLAVGLKEEGIQLYDAGKLSPVGAPLLRTGGEVKGLAFAPDGRTLAARTLYGNLTLWDVDRQSRLRTLLHSGDEAVDPNLAFSPDGETLASASPIGVWRWNVKTGKFLDTIGGGEVGDLVFSPDGSRIAFVRGDVWGAEVWDVAGRSRITSVEAAPQLDLAIALSPDGSLLALGGLSRTVRLLNIRTGKLLHSLDQGGNGAFTLEFSPDGRTLAVSGFEPVASLWDVASGRQIGPTLSAGDRLAMLDLSTDGRRLLEVHADGHGAVWDIDPESWKRRACELANRTLTRAEWDDLLPGRDYEPACSA
jgi:WD40 repeat protein/class 3 adenylate cyclase